MRITITLASFLLALPYTANADLLSLHNPADLATQDDIAVFINASYFEANDYTAQKNYADDWEQGSYRTPPNRNLAILNARLATGVNYKHWQLALIHRKDAWVISNKDTTRLVYLDHIGASPEANKRYDLDLALDGFEARGLRVSHGMMLKENDDWNIALGAGLSILEGGTRSRTGELSGFASTMNNGYQFDVDMYESYSKDTYRYIKPGSPSARGYAFDLAANIQWQDDIHIKLIANDLLGKLTWENMPYIETQGTSNILIEDADGNTHFRFPKVSKRDLNRRTITQSLHTKLHAEITKDYHHWSFTAGSSWIKDFWMPQLGVSYKINSNWKTAANYDTRFQTLQLGIQHRWGYFAIRSDGTNMDNANGYGVMGGVKIEF